MPVSNTTHKHGTSILNLLPNEVIVHSAAFLSTPSRALLAVSQCCSSQATQAIIEQFKWDTLDFGLLGKEAASKMTDGDLVSILNLINARDNLKTLKITGCSGIIGSGFNPLRNSTVLEEIDLRNKSMVLKESSVVPILSSMLPPNVPAASSSLLLVRVPRHWRDRKRSVFAEFLNVFDEVLKDRNYRCCNEKCGSLCQTFDPAYVTDEYTFINQHGDLYGIANFICTYCKKIFCEQQECMLKDFCQDCEHQVCMDCSPTYYLHCEVCVHITCIGCSETCDTCKQPACDSDCDVCPTSVVRCCKGLNCQTCVPQLQCSGCEEECLMSCEYSRPKLLCPECCVKCEHCLEDFCCKHCEEEYFDCLGCSMVSCAECSMLTREIGADYCCD